MLKVLMTADTVGGVWTYSLELARALAPHGAHVLLAAMGRPMSAEQRREADAVGNLTVHDSSYKLEWMDDPWDDVAAAGGWLLTLDRQFAPDVVHLNGYTHGGLPFAAPKLVVAHSCVLSWWRAVKGYDAPASQWDRYRDAVAAGVAAADLLVAPTRAMLAAIDDCYGVAPARAEVIYNARDVRAFPPGPKEPFVLSAGRMWDEAKNVAALNQVAGGVPWPIYVAGEADAPPGGGGRAGSGTVRPLGMLPPRDLATWLGRASIYALPARYEPFGLSILEAALAGCAPVIGDIPSLREVWADAAVFVPPDDHAALRAAIADLIADPAKRARVAARARVRAMQYTPRRMAEAYLAAYRSLVREPVAALP
ncbi:MAG TPA: glycosyltransferase family 4 protein [Tepidisphaeraceae bacterium]|nr:glycosyltransferase family 4 protein [Tepidisphaeraceae bacterium]